MKQIIENQARACAQLLEHVYSRDSDDLFVLEKAFRTRSISLLFEQTDGLSDNATLANIENARVAVSKIVDILKIGFTTEKGGSTDSGLVNALKQLLEKIPNQATISGAIVADDPDQAKEVIALVTTSTKEATQAAATIQSAFVKIAGELKKLKPEDGTKTLIDLALASDQAESQNFISAKNLDSGLKKSFAVPGWFADRWEAGEKSVKASKGTLNFIKKVFSGSGKREIIDANLFATNVKTMQYDKFLAAAKAMQTAEGETKKGADDAGEASAAVAEKARQVAAGEAPAGETQTDGFSSGDEKTAGKPDDTGPLTTNQEIAADKKGTALAKAAGPGPIGKAEWDEIVSKLPALFAKGGKRQATKKRSEQGVKFRAAINAKAKKDVFDIFEGRLLTSTRKDNTDDDDETFSRWKELAGIKS